jgi:hypothetical protein
MWEILTAIQKPNKVVRYADNKIAMHQGRIRIQNFREGSEISTRRRLEERLRQLPILPMMGELHLCWALCKEETRI